MAHPVSDIRGFLGELKRRRVYRVAAVYLFAGFITIQVADMVFPGLLLPPWAFTLVVALVILGFPIAVVLAWAFDITPDGVRRTESRAHGAAPDPGRSPEAEALVTSAPDRGRSPEAEALMTSAGVRRGHTGSGPDESAAGSAGLAAAAAGPSTAASDAHGVAGKEREPERSIAVLPFVNMSPEVENDYFSDGMTEELINAFVHLDGLRVAARTSAFAFKNRHEDVRTIGRVLGVTTVLEGSVRKSGSRLRVTAQLIDVSDGYHLWSQTYDRELADVFAIQEEIARAIVDTLKVRLVGEPGPGGRLLKRYTDDLEAYNLYLKGRYCWNKRTEEGLRSSVAYFEQAAAIDSDYALAHAGLADAYALLGIGEYGFMPPREVIPRARSAALRALEIDPGVVEAQTQVAHIKAFYEWDLEGADAEFRKAIEIDPQYAFAYHWYALLLAAMGRHDEAIAMELRARELEPLSLIINKNVGTILYYAGRRDEALEEYRRALELEPNFARTHFYLGLELAAQAEYREAIAELERAIELDPGNAVMRAALGYAYGRTGERSMALDVLGGLREQRSRQYVPALNLAMVHTGLDEPDAAFEWLEAAHEERSSWLVSLAVEPVFEGLRPDPRFGELTARIGLSEGLWREPGPRAASDGAF